MLLRVHKYTYRFERLSIFRKSFVFPVAGYNYLTAFLHCHWKFVGLCLSIEFIFLDVFGWSVGHSWSCRQIEYHALEI